MPPLYRLVEVGIYSLLNFLPLMVLALYPFRHRLRFSKTATVGLVVALSLVQIFLGWQAAFFSTNAGLLSAVSTLLYAAFYFFAVKVKVGKTGFTLLLLSNNASFIVITSKCLEGILFPSLAYESYRWSFSLCMLMTEAVVWGPLFIYMKKVYTPAVEREPSGLEWRYLWLIPFTFYIIWYYTLYGNSTKSSLELALEPKNTIALFFINAGAFLVYYIVARLVIEQQKNLRLQENNHLLEMQNLQYDYLQDKIKETRRYKHDVRHHIALMQELLKKGEYDKLSEYLNAFRDSMPDISERIYCKNTSVSALLAYFAQIAESSQRASAFSVIYSISVLLFLIVAYITHCHACNRVNVRDVNAVLIWVEFKSLAVRLSLHSFICFIKLFVSEVKAEPPCSAGYCR